MVTENERLAFLGLFPTPDGVVFDQADIQQFIVYRSPLVVVGSTAINRLQHNGSNILDVKYYDGTNMVNVELQTGGVIVWRI